MCRSRRQTNRITGHKWKWANEDRIVDGGRRVDLVHRPLVNRVPRTPIHSVALQLGCGGCHPIMFSDKESEGGNNYPGMLLCYTHPRSPFVSPPFGHFANIRVPSWWRWRGEERERWSMIMTLDRSFSLRVFLVLLLDRVSGWGWAKKNRSGYAELKEWVDEEEDEEEEVSPICLCSPSP